MTIGSPPGAAPATWPSGVVTRLLRTAPVPGPPSWTGSSGEPGDPAFDGLDSLDGLERARASRMVDPVRAAQFVIGRAALRALAADLMGVDPGHLRSGFSCPRCSPGGRADHGQPGYTIGGEHVPLALSLSRAAGFVLVGALPASSDGSCAPHRLGVDLTAVVGVDFDGFDDVALTARERTAVEEAAPEGRMAARARLWARKEALAKALGTGFGRDGDGVAGVGRPTGTRASAATRRDPGRATRPLDPGDLDVLRDTRITDLPRIDGTLLIERGLAAAVAVVQ